MIRSLRPAVLAGVLAVGIAVGSPALARAQGVDGYVSFTGIVLPDVARNGDARDPVPEFRLRFSLDARTSGRHVRLTLAGFAEGLVADRKQDDPTLFGIARPQEAHIEFFGEKADLRVGLSRVVWGRLDEFLPTDVVNPLDLTRFFLEGRVEGRMAVPMVRGRLLPTDRFTVEAIYVPVFRRGRFDQLDEGTSPFNLAPQQPCPSGLGCPRLPTAAHEPERTVENAQGGARVALTTGRVDWAVSAYRGFESFPIYELALPDAVSGAPLLPIIHERFPRFTMIGGDFETVRGEWGVRGEIAGYPRRTWQAENALAAESGQAIDAGVGLDRKAGSYRVGGNVLVSRRWRDAAAPIGGGPQTAGDESQTEVNLVAVIDRSFARERHRLRTFAIYNPQEGSAFTRLIATFGLRDNVAFEASGGWFTGDGPDLLSRFDSRDFVLLRLKAFF